MDEKLMKLPVAELRTMAKAQGLKGTSAMRKQELADWLAAHGSAEVPAVQSAPPQPEKKRPGRPKKAVKTADTGEPKGESSKREEPKEETPREKSTAEPKAAEPEKKEPEKKETAEPKEAEPEKKETAEPKKAENAEQETAPRKVYISRRNPQENQRNGRNAGQEQRQRNGQNQNRGTQGRQQNQDRRQQNGRPQGQEQRQQNNRPQGQEQRQQNNRPQGQEQRQQNGRPQGQEQRQQNNRPQGQERRQQAVRQQERQNIPDVRPVQTAQQPEPQAAAEKEIVQAAEIRSTEPVAPEKEMQELLRTEVPAAQEGMSVNHLPEELQSAADRGAMASGILEVMAEGFGFIRSANYLPGDDDIYVSPSQIRRFNLKTGDIVTGIKRIRTEKEKFGALLYVNEVNGLRPAEIVKRTNFEDMTPVFPNQRIHLEMPGGSTAMRIVDLISPVGKGQRGMIVSPPKAGKTTLLKEIAKVVTETVPDMHLIILLIDERPEEVTDIKEYIEGPQVEVIYSTFDKEPEQHKRVSEMVIERAKRLVEQHRDVMILLDSITRLARAYNLTVTPSGRTLSGGLDPAALYMPKRFFGAARNMREGGSLTILATALVDTGSRMDDVVYEEFKGTGNMELVLDRKLSERRIFPAVDILKSGTRRDDLLLNEDEREVADMIHRLINGARPEESVERILNRFANTRSNAELLRNAKLARTF